MAPSKEQAVHAINKRRPRRIILQTLPPVVLSTPTNAITVRFTMSTAATAGLKSIVPAATSELHSLVLRPSLNLSQLPPKRLRRRHRPRATRFSASTRLEGLSARRIVLISQLEE